jgi:argininosuccinate synthase
VPAQFNTTTGPAHWELTVRARAIDNELWKKVVLAYSGGLDTSIIIPWLKENYNNCEVIAVAGNVGQGDELEGWRKRPKRPAPPSSTSRPHRRVCGRLDHPLHEGRAPVRGLSAGHRHARPCIAKKLVEIAKEGADAIATAAPARATTRSASSWPSSTSPRNMKIIAPWREWNIKSRDEEIDYAEAHNVPLKINRETNYSKDKNLWHLSHEGLDLEDPANEPPVREAGAFWRWASPHLTRRTSPPM